MSIIPNATPQLVCKDGQKFIFSGTFLSQKYPSLHALILSSQKREDLKNSVVSLDITSSIFHLVLNPEKLKEYSTAKLYEVSLVAHKFQIIEVLNLLKPFLALLLSYSNDIKRGLQARQDIVMLFNKDSGNIMELASQRVFSTKLRVNNNHMFYWKCAIIQDFRLFVASKLGSRIEVLDATTSEQLGVIDQPVNPKRPVSTPRLTTANNGKIYMHVVNKKKLYEIDENFKLKLLATTMSPIVDAKVLRHNDGLLKFIYTDGRHIYKYKQDENISQTLIDPGKTFKELRIVGMSGRKMIFVNNGNILMFYDEKMNLMEKRVPLESIENAMNCGDDVFCVQGRHIVHVNCSSEAFHHIEAKFDLALIQRCFTDNFYSLLGLCVRTQPSRNV